MTAVEWLVKELENHHIKIDIKNTVAYQQAKEMEKEQIVEAYGTKTSKTTQQGIDVYQITNGEHYYNETYGK